ncbi:MAG: CvpA family protein [Pseudomonadales bacterium]
MNWADWFIVGVVGLSCVVSLMRGFVQEAMSLAVWFLAIAIAMLFDDQLGALMVNKIDTPSLRNIIAFSSLFVVTMVLGSLVTKLLGQLVNSVGLGATDRILGTFFGFARGVIIVLAILIFVPAVITVEGDEWWQSSQLIPHVLRLEDWSREATSAVIQLFSSIEPD